jgi:hypothetical protein
MRQNDPLFEQFVGRWLPFPFVAEHSQLPDISPNQPENYGKRQQQRKYGNICGSSYDLE